MNNRQQPYHQYRRYYHRLGGLYQDQAVKDVTFLAVSLLTVAFCGFFAIRPSLRTISGLIKEIRDKGEASQKLEQKINSLSLAQKEYLRVQPDLVYIEAALPKKSEFSQLIKQLEYLAYKNNVQLISFKLEKADLLPVEPKSELLTLAVDFGAAGNYEDLKKFLTDLEKLERLVILKNFDFAEEKSGLEEETSIMLTIQAQIYSLP